MPRGTGLGGTGLGGTGLEIARRHARVAAVVAGLLLTACSGPISDPSPGPPTSTIGGSATVRSWSDVPAEIERQITSGPQALDNLEAVLVSVDGRQKLAYYRHGFTPATHEHVWSVTKSVVATLIGIAIGDGLIKDVDQPLSALLPGHRKAMTPAVASATLRQMMSMSAGFTSNDPSPELYESAYADDGDFVDFLLRRGASAEPGRSWSYSNVSADLVAAVLADALRHADPKHPQTVLDYARSRLFAPLGIETIPAYTGQFPRPITSSFRTAGFAWCADPDGEQRGAFGIRLTAPDLLAIGDLYLNRGVWHEKRILPESWVDEVTAPSPAEHHYGLLWWRFSDPPDLIYAAQGAFGQRIVVQPSKHAVIVTLMKTPPDLQGPEDPGINDLLVKTVVPAIG